VIVRLVEETQHGQDDPLASIELYNLNDFGVSDLAPCDLISRGVLDSNWALRLRQQWDSIHTTKMTVATWVPHLACRSARGRFSSTKQAVLSPPNEPRGRPKAARFRAV
jgi:hypothetical protein